MQAGGRACWLAGWRAGGLAESPRRAAKAGRPGLGGAAHTGQEGLACCALLARATIAMKLLALSLLVGTAAAFAPTQSRLRSPMTSSRSAAAPLRMSAESFTIAILGDLHLDPRYMDDHTKGRQHFLPIVTKDGKPREATCVVSLGDLGESKSVDETKQLFAGTSGCSRRGGWVTSSQSCHPTT